MKMARRRKKLYVETLDSERCDSSRIGENAAASFVRQQDGDTRCRPVASLDNMADINALGIKIPQGNLPKTISANLSGECDAETERGQIVGKDRRRTAQGHLESGCEQLPFGGKIVRQSVEDQVEVQLSCNRHIKRIHRWKPLLSITISYHILRLRANGSCPVSEIN